MPNPAVSGINASDGSTLGPGQKVVVGPFITTNLATTPASNSVVPLGGILSSPATGTPDWIAPYAGKILAAGLVLGTAYLTTTGTAKFLIAKNGTTTAALKLQPSIGAANLTKTVVTNTDATTAALSFVRGDKIGWRFTSGSTVNPATVEGYITMVVEL